jgi:magnesium-transporting ATPase (P-type)
MCSRWYFGSTLFLLQVDRVGTMKNEEELRLELIRVRQELPTDAMKYIVLDGKALDVCLDAPVLRAKDKAVPSVTSPIAVPIYQELLKVSVLCDAVVCCRVSPLQKALMVSLVKDNSPGLKTLAIGDGANDVPMIQTAHIGVGIAGQEGMQAVRASDVAIGQFRFLRRLTMVHGRANYRRAALMVCYMFYKNIVLCLAPFFYKASYGTTEDGISRFIGVTFYNTVHTAWPILLVAFYDFDITAKHSERYPRLYHSGPAKSRFNTRVFLFWVFLSFVHSFVIFLFAWYGSGGCDELGQVCTQGTTTFMGGHLTTLLLTIAVTVKVCSEFARFYWWTMFFLVISILAYPVLMFAYTAQYSYSFGVSGDALQQYSVAQVAFSYGTTWISILGVVGIVLLIDIAIKNYYRYFKTSFDHLVQEAESNAHPVMYTTDRTEYRNNANNGMASDIEAANKEDDQDPFVVLDRLDEELWALEKSGHLVIPGPKLPTFKDEPSGGSVQATRNPTHDNRARNDSVELTEAGGKKNAVAGGKTEGKTEGKTGGGQLPRRGSHAIERAAANNGMSQDHHASVTMAGTMRRQISDAEN